MRNQYADKCFLCKRPVSAGAGFFQRLGGRWVVRCKRCVGAGNSVEGRVTDEKLLEKLADWKKLGVFGYKYDILLKEAKRRKLIE